MSKLYPIFIKMSVYRVANLDYIKSILNTVYNMYNFTSFR